MGSGYRPTAFLRRDRRLERADLHGFGFRMRAAELPRRLQSFSEMVSTLERLAKQTAVHRCVADADRLALTDNPATEEHYTSYLVRTYGFQAPLESALSIVP